MSLIALGLGLAKFVPDIIDLFDGDDNKASEAAEKVVGIAENLTGHQGDDALTAIQQNPELQLKFKKLVMEDKYFLEKLDHQDRSSARKMYKEAGHEQADKIANEVINKNLYFTIGIALIQILALSYFTEMSNMVVAIIGNVSGLLIKSLLDERLQVISFYFGSSLGSKHKDKKS